MEPGHEDREDPLAEIIAPDLGQHRGLRALYHFGPHAYRRHAGMGPDPIGDLYASAAGWARGHRGARSSNYLRA